MADTIAETGLRMARLVVPDAAGWPELGHPCSFPRWMCVDDPVRGFLTGWIPTAFVRREDGMGAFALALSPEWPTRITMQFSYADNPLLEG